MEIVAESNQRSPVGSDKAGLLLRWGEAEYSVDSIDQYTFSVSSYELAGLYAGPVGSAIHDGAIRGVDETIEFQFRIRNTDGDQVRCSFFDLPISTRDRLGLLIERSHSPETDALQSLSYDDLALGNTDEAPEVKSLPTKNSSTLRNTIVSIMLAASMIVILSWVLMVVRSQSTISVTNSVMMGNYQAVNTPLEGKLLDLRVAVGDRVEAGQALATISNPVVKQELQVVETKISRAQRDLDVYRRQSREINSMMKVARLMLQKRLGAEIAIKTRIKADLRAARSQLKRMEWLRRKRYAKEEKYQEARALRDRWVAELKSQSTVIEGIALAEQAAAKNVIVNDARITNPMSDIRTKIDLTQSMIEELKETRDLYSGKAKPVELIAPSSGTIFAVYRRPGEVLKHAEEAVAISRDGKSWAIGHVLAEVAANIRPGQPVEIEIPSYDITATGVVEGIGHRAVYGRGGYTADFRGGAFDVPIRVAIEQTDKPIPSGLRLNMTIRVKDHLMELRNWMDGLMVRIFGKDENPRPSPRVKTVDFAILAPATAKAKTHTGNILPHKPSAAKVDRPDTSARLLRKSIKRKKMLLYVIPKRPRS